MSLKQSAISLVYALVSEGAPLANNPTIDRIEKRFRIQGAAEHYERARAKAAKEYAEKMDPRTWEEKLWQK